MKKIRLITASFGDSKQELVIKGSLASTAYKVDTVYYNNSNTHSRKNSLHPRLKAKIPKMMEWSEYPDYDYYIWVDSQFVIMDGFIDKMMEFVDEEADLFLFPHGKRNSIQEEVNFMNDKLTSGNIYMNERYRGEYTNEQVALYLSDKSFVDNRLFAGGCFMYTKCLFKNRNYNMMTDWMLHNTLYSIQDQLSLPYLLHKHQVKYKVYPHLLMRNDFLVHNFAVFY